MTLLPLICVPLNQSSSIYQLTRLLLIIFFCYLFECLFVTVRSTVDTWKRISRRNCKAECSKKERSRCRSAGKNYSYRFTRYPEARYTLKCVAESESGERKPVSDLRPSTLDKSRIGKGQWMPLDRICVEQVFRARVQTAKTKQSVKIISFSFRSSLWR